jgi:glycosyltransferase involved in cell wall biosynthesis
MKVVIACGAMDFGPRTPLVKALGGSETAALMAAQEIAKRGHDVTMYCNLPPAGRPDAVPHGHVEDGVTYKHLASYVQEQEKDTSTDIVIIVRDPGIAVQRVGAKKKVLWMHDIATKRGMQRAFDHMAWSIDEVWCVSEFHRQQIHSATGYPLEYIHALRNGVVRVPTLDLGRTEKQLLYAARPERGLDNLIMPGGIMDQLPEYKLVVAMYDHFPEHMRGYYEGVFTRMSQMPNVEFVGGKAQTELRQIMRNSAAYIYPSQFEEVSCILARECIETKTPIFTTKVAALPETLGASGIFFEDWLARENRAEPLRGSVEWATAFAQFFREGMADPAVRASAISAMAERTDLYWDGVAEMMEKRFVPVPYKNGIGPTVIACVIAMNNEDTILRMLKSLEGQVDAVNLAIGPSTDRTAEFALEWSKRTGIPVNVIPVPKIEPYKFGFDDARKASMQGSEYFDWMMWIDTDEYLSGDIRPWLRQNMLDGYIIPQHHFTVEPRGVPMQIDRPARLLRTDRGYQPRGHIHEHLEIPEKGVGRCFMLPGVDIGHIGYANERVRKDRFERNWPFLEWDHSTEEGRARPLHAFLWFRDIVHRMRVAVLKKDMPLAKKLADEAVAYYNENIDKMGSFGSGIQMSLAYISEVNHALGRGIAMGISLQLEDREPLNLQGRYTDFDHLVKVLTAVIKPEFDDRLDKYWG